MSELDIRLTSQAEVDTIRFSDDGIIGFFNSVAKEFGIGSDGHVITLSMNDVTNLIRALKKMQEIL